MKNNKLATSELRSLANSAISLNNAANEVMNMWLQSLVNNERDESTARLILAVSELLDSSTSKIESISYSAAIFLIPICISFDTAEKRRYATYLILNRRFSFEF
ncbi:hypothetical protein TI51_002184 [Escherichia coli]|nr:hypothetical protein [Escherichia coli]